MVYGPGITRRLSLKRLWSCIDTIYTVGQKTVPMFDCFAKIEVEQIKKIR